MARRALSKIANVRTVGGIVFPGSPLAATKEELQQIAGYWPDIEKSRAEAKRLLKEAGAEGLTFELLNRNVDPAVQLCRYLDHRRVEQDRPACDAEGGADRSLVRRDAQRQFRRWCWKRTARASSTRCSMSARYLPHSVYTENYGNYDDQHEIDLYQQMIHETDFPKQRVLMREFEKYALDTQAHAFVVTWWYRIVPYQAYVKGWKISPSHFVNQDLATVWLDK